ncbi:hypothetical protein IMCC12053_2370 [Celeribacter marinus]|uniref:GapR-like DNA-binding domain-containing protein n=2 Tax=Celeribacter marinus TaxID=1397108 RepID=A0A0N7HIW0_9RHOB|nr:hypothetical protein IMCC12053_2370 [Celeribacter marinus]
MRTGAIIRSHLAGDATGMVRGACLDRGRALGNGLDIIQIKRVSGMMDDTTSGADATYRVTADELRSFVERYERLEMEKKDIADQQKEVMAEAKGRGYDTKALRTLIALRKKSSDEIAEEEAVLEMYKEALGMS